GLVQLLGKSRSFLDFSGTADLRVALSSSAWQAAAFAIGLALVAQLLPTIAAAKDTIITYKQEQARSLKRPFWQRAWLDVLLLFPAGYGYYQLQQQGSIVSEAAESGTPFVNPLLFVVPILTVFAMTLLFLRILPLIMALVSWLLVQTNSIGVLMAVRQLARAPRVYTMPLVLLVLTVSLAVFTASLAQTLDFQLYDEARYNIGADVNLRGAGLEFGVQSIVPVEEDASRSQAIFLPLDEYLAFPGVTAATRVGRYNAEAQLGNRRVEGLFLGVDRADFGQVSYWRWDFAPYRLGSLLNALAVSPDAVLVSADFAAARGLRTGDFLRLTVDVGDGEVELNGQIAGLINYFPTWYPQEDEALFVGNLETLFAQTGGELPYEVWLSTAGEPDEEG
ncbi:MAG: hypothetical protein KDE51_21900, partial [Anaerolineales bacterium]|nr:hypothetical protein [Anaerolineales bacterium]